MTRSIPWHLMAGLALLAAGCGDDGGSGTSPDDTPSGGDQDTVGPPPDAPAGSDLVGPDIPGDPGASETDPLFRAGEATVEGIAASGGAIAGSNGRIAVCSGNGVVVLDALTLAPVAGGGATPAHCRALALDGDHGVASLGGGQWTSFAAGAASSPATVAGPEAYAVAIGAERVYAAAGPSGIASAPRDLSSPAVTHGAATDTRGVLLFGGDLYVADGRKGIHRMTLAADGTPSVAASIDPVDVDWSLAPLAGSLLVAARGGAGIAVLETAGGGLAVTATLDTSGIATAAAAGAGGLVLVADWTGARLIDASDAAAPKYLAREHFPPGAGSRGRALGAAVEGGAFQVLGLDRVTRLIPNAALAVPELALNRPGVLVEVLPGDDALGSAGVLIRNVGRAELHIDDIAATSPRATFLLDPSPIPDVDLVIPVDDAGFFEMTVTGTEPVDFEVTFTSNDPDAQAGSFPVRVNPPRLQVGSIAPDFVLPSLDGPMLTLAEQKGKVIYLKVFNAL